MSDMDNLVDTFENLIAAYLWHDSIYFDDINQEWHASKNLLRAKKELAQRLAETLGQDKGGKNAPKENL